MQVADLVLENIGAPEWVIQTIMLVLALGFPVVLFFSWAYEVTPEGIKRESEIDHSQSITYVTGRKLDRAIVVVLVIALAYFAYDKLVLSTDRDAALVEATTQAVTEQVATEQEEAAEPDKSIAVLPFVNMSSDEEQEYFSDGISEEILNLLAKIEGLKVIGRTSSFAFKGKNDDLRVIGKALDVRTVLEGSVRKSGDRVRITAQLIDVSSGAHIWSETYDRTLTDIFEVQDSVASEIIEALQIHVGVVPKRGRPTENTEAYSLYLRAKSAMSKSNNLAAEKYLLNALKLDPEFAEAHESLAYVYWNLWGHQMEGSIAKMKTHEAALKALVINPNLKLAKYFSTSGTNEFEASLRQIEMLEQIIQENPSHILAIEILMWKLMYSGYIREALELAEYYIELEPLLPAAHEQLFHALMASGHKDEALGSLKLVDQLGSVFSKSLLGFFYLGEKQYELSKTYFEAHYQKMGLPTDWLEGLYTGASNSKSGRAYLDQLLPQVMATTPEKSRVLVQAELDFLYLKFGYLDRYFELIHKRLSAGLVESGGDIQIWGGTKERDSGFTSDPEYLKIAEETGKIALWEKRGPPDFCKKLADEWQCE
jgi:TolB-like protein